MAQQTVNVGITPNDGTGDSIRSSFIKVNQNFTELYGNISAPSGSNGAIQYQNSGALAGATGVTTDGTDLSVTGSTRIQQVHNKINVSALAATGTIDVDVLDGDQFYYTLNASANWVFNLQGNANVSLDTLMANSESITVSFYVTNGGTAYYPTSVTVDGGAPATIMWVGGTPSSGTINSIEEYKLTAIKTTTATFTVLGTQTPFV